MAHRLRVALVWCVAKRLTDITVRFERYAQGFREIGCDVITVCLAEAAVGYMEPTHIAPSEEAFSDPRFWAKVNADVAIVITWLRYDLILKAIKTNCRWLVGITDSDGQVGVRIHPGATLRGLVNVQSRWWTKLRAGSYWLRQYMAGSSDSERAVIESASSCDKVVLSSERAVINLTRFFVAYRRVDLIGKLVAIPYPIDQWFLSPPLSDTRARSLVAIGRWDDPQKDAPLLARTLARYYNAGGDFQTFIIGINGEKIFQSLSRRWPRVQYLGTQKPEKIAAYLRQARVLIIPSVWESGPIVMNEALASGCSIVGTDAIPALVDVCQDGHYGTIEAHRTATSLTRALQNEVRAWDQGDRNPTATAFAWRPKFEPAVVCRSLISGFGDLIV